MFAPLTDYPWGSCLPRSLTLSFDLRIHHYTPEYPRVATPLLHSDGELFNQFRFSVLGPFAGIVP